MSELITWLRAHLDTDERLAQSAIRDPRYLRDERTTADDGRWRTRDHPHDECIVEGAGIMVYDEGGHTAEQARHIATHDPARVLRQVQAHRAILDDHADIPGDGINYTLREQERAEDVIKALASMYSDRDGFKEEWSA